MKILSLSVGTLGYLKNYVSGTTLCYELMGSRHGAHTVNLSPEVFLKFKDGSKYPEYDNYGHLECIRKGEHIWIDSDDYCWFLQRIANRQFDIISNLNGVNLDLTKFLKEQLNIPCVFTFEQAGARAGYPLYNTSTEVISEKAHQEWSRILDLADGIITWHINDIPRLEQIGASKIDVYHAKYALVLSDRFQELKTLPKKRDQAAFVGSIIGARGHWKRCWEIAEVVPFLLEQTPVEQFIICGTIVDREGREIVCQLQNRYPDQVRHVCFPSDKSASEKVITESYFVYTPIGGNQIGSVPVECWALETPILLTGSDFGTDGIDCIRPEGLPDMSQKICELYKNAKLYQRIQANGRKRYGSEFTPEIMADRYFAIFEEIRNNHGRTRSPR
jgi:glycosyltransferase involved in cell wall biosynthesis